MYRSLLLVSFFIGGVIYCARVVVETPALPVANPESTSTYGNAVRAWAVERAALPKGMLTRGVIVAPDGAEVQGANIRFDRHEGRSPLELQSDSRGRFWIPIDAGLDYGAIRTARITDPNGDRMFFGQVALEPSMRVEIQHQMTVSGRLGAGEDPIPNAAITFRIPPSGLATAAQFLGRLVSQADGSFAGSYYTRPDASVVLSIQLPDGSVLTARDPRPVPESAKLLINLEDLETSQVVIIDEHGDTVDGVTVSAGSSAPQWRLNHVVSTNDEGVAQFRTIGDSVALVAVKEGFEYYQTKRESTDSPRAAVLKLETVAGAPPVTGVVVDSFGRAAADIKVLLEPRMQGAENGWMSVPYLTRVSDHRGEFMFFQDGGRDYEITVVQDSHELLRFTRVPYERAMYSLRPENALVIALKAASLGNAWRSSPTHYILQNVETGSFLLRHNSAPVTIRGLPEGRYNIYAWMSDNDLYGQNFVTVEKSGTVECEVTCLPARVIRGKLENELGQGVSGVKVRLRNGVWTESIVSLVSSVTTSVDGTFSLPAGLEDDVELVVSAEESGVTLVLEEGARVDAVIWRQ